MRNAVACVTVADVGGATDEWRKNGVPGTTGAFRNGALISGATADNFQVATGRNSIASQIS
ncbi:MAG: hypothetical protein ACREJO_09395 [Phycisphaerales bacterium]